MRKALIATAALVLAAVGGEPGATPAAAEDQIEVPACVEVQSHARYGAMGYDHIVRLRNGCDDRAACDVSTSVSPRAIHVEIEAGQERELVTYRGSPARSFDTRVRCELD